MLTRTVGRELREGDEIVTTRLGRRNVAPWLELAHDLGLVVRFADYDLSDVEKQLSDRTRVVAFPWASNALGTLVDAARICELARGGRASPGSTQSTTRHTGRSTWPRSAPTSSSARPTSSTARTGLAFARRELLDRWRPYKVRPAPGYETGTAQHELLAGFVAAVEYLESVGLEAIVAHERELGERFLAGLPEGLTLYGRQTMDGRVPTFAVTLDGLTPTEIAAHLGEHGIFVWDGNYYAPEVMKRLGLQDGAVRIGIVHYNTADEVDRLLVELRKLAGKRA